jgi:transcription elongation GreA/GreB family factor
MKDRIRLKQELFDLCCESVEQRISTIESSLLEVRESRNNETKSSAGDKYETGRAMLQIEEDNYKKQLHQALLLSNQLRQIDPTKQKQKAEPGSLVSTNQGMYFISVGLGKITLADQTFLCISPASPMGQKLIGREKGFQFEFIGTTVIIQEVC